MHERRSPPFWPREHGFWVMAAAVLLGALLRDVTEPWLWLTALATLAVAALAGGLLRRTIRQHGAVQLASAALLALLGLPVDAVAGRELWPSLMTAAAWAAIFVPSALAVRSTFWRAKRDDVRAAGAAAGAVLLPVVAAVGLGLLGYAAEALACALAGFGLGLVALWRPTVKQLRPVGLSLAAIALVAAGVIGL